MPFEIISGNIFDAPTEAIVNPVNTVGVMGKGLALAFRNRYPAAYFSAYVRDCRGHSLRIGAVTSWRCDREARLLVNFPTKRHYRDPAHGGYVRVGLRALGHLIRQEQLRSIALPALGCGLGGLPWPWVRDTIRAFFERRHPELRVVLYAPEDERRE